MHSCASIATVVVAVLASIQFGDEILSVIPAYSLHPLDERRPETAWVLAHNSLPLRLRHFKTSEVKRLCDIHHVGWHFIGVQALFVSG